MELGPVFFSVAQLLVAVALSAVVAYLSVFLFEQATKGLDEWEELRKGNAAVGVVLGAIALATAWMVRPALGVSLAGQDLGRALPYYALALEAVQVVFALVLAVVMIIFALWLFDRLTGKLDEWAELQRGNLAVAALLAGVILGIALLGAAGIEGLQEAIAPLLF